MNLSPPRGSPGVSPRPARADGIRILGPLPTDVVLCLCCGPLPVSGDLAATAGQHTRATAHPTVYAAGGT